MRRHSRQRTGPMSNAVPNAGSSASEASAKKRSVVLTVHAEPSGAAFGAALAALMPVILSSVRVLCR